MRSPANIFRHLVHHHERPEIRAGDATQAQNNLVSGRDSAGTPATTVTQPDVLNYLGYLADDYRLPRKLVYAVADTESSMDPTTPPHPNYEKRSGEFVYDKGGVRPPPRLLLGAACLAFLIVPLSSFRFSQVVPRTTHSPMTIRENGYFRADLGYFFIENGRLDVYDAALDSGVIWDNVLGRYASARDVQRELSQKSKPYYHEVFQLTRGDWVRTEREFAPRPTRYLDFAPCDARDQLDLSDDPLAGLDAHMRTVFPRGVKVKGLAEFGRGQFAVVVISEPPKGPSSIYAPGTYALRMLLLSRSTQGWNTSGNLQAERAAYYCGMRNLETTFKEGETSVVALLYSSAPQGSRIASVERQIRSFLIRPTGNLHDSE